MLILSFRFFLLPERSSFGALFIRRKSWGTGSIILPILPHLLNLDRCNLFPVLIKKTRRSNLFLFFFRLSLIWWAAYSPCVFGILRWLAIWVIRNIYKLSSIEAATRWVAIIFGGSVNKLPSEFLIRASFLNLNRLVKKINGIKEQKKEWKGREYPH